MGEAQKIITAIVDYPASQQTKVAIAIMLMFFHLAVIILLDKKTNNYNCPERQINIMEQGK